MYLDLPSMTIQTSPVAILLQNRAAFYRHALERFPDLKMRELFETFDKSQSIVYLELEIRDWNDDLPAGLSLEDPIKKPDLGERWGRTVVSYSEFFDRAKALEQLVLLTMSLLEDANLPNIGKLRHETENRLKLLLELEDSLRYHKLRLLNE